MIAAYVEVNPIEPAVLLFGKVVREAIVLTSREVSARVLPEVKRLASAPGPVKYKLRWKSTKQRRKFFATKGFGKGIPYRRTGNLANAWRFDQTVVDDTVLVSLENPLDAAQFVYGAFDNPLDQQPFHKDTGWISAPTLQTQAFDLFDRGLREVFTPTAQRLFEVVR